MALRDFYENAKSKISGKQQEDVDFEDEEDYEDDYAEDDYYDARNERVTPVSRRVTPYEQDSMRPAHSVSHRSSGLDSLFSSTVPTNDEASQMTQPMAPIHSEGSSAAASRYSYAATAATAAALSEGNSLRSETARNRQVAVIKPDNYEEAEVVTKSLKKKDIVVIDLRGVEKSLATRFLDFSFGATSALDGKVDVIEKDIYSITVAEPIRESELERIRRDGLI